MENKIIATSLEKGMSYQVYSELIKQLVSKGKSTGPEQNAKRIEFTKLNVSRMRRLDKTITIPKQAIAGFQDVQEGQTWLVIIESWCADGAQTIPILNKIVEEIPSIDLKIVLRDENPELIDLFLTNGTRSIPKLIVLDNNKNVLNTWGPRSRRATKMVETYKSQNGKIDDQFKRSLQIWYNNDKGKSIIEDVANLATTSFFVEEN